MVEIDRFLEEEVIKEEEEKLRVSEMNQSRDQLINRNSEKLSLMSNKHRQQNNPHEE